MMNLKNIALSVLAIIVGEIALILLTTIVQEVLFNGINLHSSTIMVIAFGGFLTFLAATMSGIISRIISPVYTLIIPSVISFFIVTEMTYLIFSGITQDPVWFDVLSGSGLILGIWIGYNFRGFRNSFSIKIHHPNIRHSE